ncbi:PEP-CTERM sorting domain-containing protein [Bradyrhizobium icense]|uniref:PEP-CTERM sorting domain-containing protein n=1 Tax=Bradyrhizobium icense TaxID=1274631 RepID=UPI0009F4AE18|nr:PEP-CTERM sorting domain-containing protein [Bradyrhizobium icense]
MRILLCVAFLLTVIFSHHHSASAATVLINASVGGTTIFSNNCPGPSSCTPDGYLTPLYQVNQGDVVDLGSVELGPAFTGPGRSQFPIYSSYQGVLGFSWGPLAFSATGPLYASCFGDGCIPDTPPTLVERLLFLVPAGATELQLAFTGPYSYQPPNVTAAVPEASTWAMMILGFAYFGYLTHRRRKISRRAQVGGTLPIPFVTRSLLLAIPIAIGSCLCGPATAATYNIDAFAPGGLPGSARTWQIDGAGAFDGYNGYQTAFYEFLPGDHVNFGFIIFAPEIINGRYQNYVRRGSVGVQYSFPGEFQQPYDVLASCWLWDADCAISDSYPNLTVGLNFLLPPGANGIQVFWSGTYSYAPPVPEPSTWAMLLIGFAGLSILGRSRRKTSTAQLPIT